MGYQYDIFISYKRDEQTRRWISKHLKPLLEHYVNLELGRLPVFYIDTQLETGGTWPLDLGAALGTSRTIISLWSKTYLNSIWCTTEISHMLERESKTGFRTAERPSGLVFPVVIHDGETMPINLSSIQKAEIQECFNVNMSPDSPRAETLAEKLGPIGRTIAEAIQTAPAWQEKWRTETADDLYRLFYNHAQVQQTMTPKFIPA